MKMKVEKIPKPVFKASTFNLSSSKPKETFVFSSFTAESVNAKSEHWHTSFSVIISLEGATIPYS